MMVAQRRSSRTAGIPQRVGKRAPRPGKDGFRKADIKDTVERINAYLGEPQKRKRQAKPVFARNGQVPDITSHVLKKLRAASRSPRGKGMCFLSRAELAVVMRKMRPRRRRVWSKPIGAMP